GILAQQSLAFAQCVTEATELEAMELAIGLSDLAHACTNMVCLIATETKEALQDFVSNITNPIGSVCKVIDVGKNVGFCLGKVMNYVAEAMVHADSEGFGWSHYAQVLEQEHQYDAEYAQQVIDSIKSWVVHSSSQEKVRTATRCIVDGVLYGNLCKVLSHAGNACCGLIVDISEFRFLEEMTECGLITKIGEISLQKMEDLGISILKSEVDLAKKSKFIKNGIKNSSSKWIEAEKQIAQASLEIRTIHEVLDELKKYGARSKMFQEEVKLYFNKLFCKDELSNLYKDFKNPLCIELMNHKKKVKMFCDLEHLMTYNLKFRPNKENGLIEGFISGGHIGKYRKSLEKTKDIVIVSERELHSGVRAIEYKHRFGSFIEQKTEYPLHWTVQDIVESIQSAWQNQKNYRIEGLHGHVIGVGKDGVWLEMFFKKLPDGNFRLKTVYPYCEKFSGVAL
ncbi:EndoU domain-containing protein, partial [Candidatus Dependentiae bacterium]|nr:EndoU domain-containing protein [Candidatus Dependentiae bacterium]